jgi:FAD-linked oxidoreductase
VDELQTSVHHAAATATRIRVMGAGHSFTPLIETPSTLLRLDALKSIGSVNDNGMIPVGAGIRLFELGPELRRRGRAQENLGDINAQSLAGAISTGTHGTGLGFGTVSTQAQWLRVLGASGEVKHWDRNENPDEFLAAATSLGSLGILVEVGLRTVPAYGLRVEQFAEDLTKALDVFVKRSREHRHHEFFWFPHTKTVLSKTGDALGEVGRAPSRVARFVGDVLLENGVFELVNQAVRLLPQQAPLACQALARLARFAGSKTLCGPSDLIFATERLSRFQEMEYALPLEKLSEAITRIEKFVSDNKIAVSFPVEVRSVQGDNLWLSPAYGRDSVFVAVHMHHALEYRKYFAGVEEIFSDLGGRPHWGKIHTKTGRDLKDLYPHWNSFQELRTQLDPNGIFLNPYLERILL